MRGRRSRHWFGKHGGDFRNGHFGRLFGGSGLRGWLRRGCGTRQVLVRESGGTLEAATQFRKALGAALVPCLGMNLLELRGQFGSAAIVAGAENKIEKFFKRRGMTRGAAQNRLEQSDSLLCETIAGKQVHVGERLRDEFLRLLIQLRINRRGGSLRLV